MKITAVEITPVQIPMKHAYGEATSIPAAVASIQTDEGVSGVGHVITLYGRQFDLLIAAARELAAQIIGDDPRYPERIHKKILPGGPGSGGIVNNAGAAIDVAVWDVAAKSAGIPLYRMLGGFQNRVPAYASLRLGRTLPTGQLPEIATSLVEQGFRAMKMNVAGPGGIAKDIERVRLVREAIGPD